MLNLRLIICFDEAASDPEMGWGLPGNMKSEGYPCKYHFVLKRLARVRSVHCSLVHPYQDPLLRLFAHHRTQKTIYQRLFMNNCFENKHENIACSCRRDIFYNLHNTFNMIVAQFVLDWQCCLQLSSVDAFPLSANSSLGIVVMAVWFKFLRFGCCDVQMHCLLNFES